MKQSIENHLISNAFNRIASIIFLKGLEEDSEVVHALHDYIKYLTREGPTSCKRIDECLNLIENLSKLKIYMNSARFNFHVAPAEFNLDKKITPHIYKTYSLIFDKIPIEKGSTLDFFVRISQIIDCKEGVQIEIEIHSSEPLLIHTDEILSQKQIREMNSSNFMDQLMIVDLNMPNQNAISIKFQLYEVENACS